jgi:hypothetical protein
LLHCFFFTVIALFIRGEGIRFASISPLVWWLRHNREHLLVSSSIVSITRPLIAPGFMAPHLSWL